MRLLYTFFIFFLLSCQSYKSLHQKAIVVDTHNDVLSTATMKGLNIENDLTGRTHSDIARFKKGGVDAQIFSIFCDERFGKDTAFKYANIEIDSLYAIIGRNSNKMMMVTNPVQLQQAIAQKKLGCLMGVEGGHMIEDKLSYLDSFYKRGVRYMTLTWNNSTLWATSALDETAQPPQSPKGDLSSAHSQLKQDASNISASSKSEVGAAENPPLGGRGAGLTAFGKQIVRRMNALGMMVDLSHVGEQTFWDAINTTTKPVIVSHSCAFTLCPVFRNLKDDQIKAVGKNGGVIHLNFYSGFLDSTYQKKVAQFSVVHKQEIDSLTALKWAGYEIEEYLLAKYPEVARNLQPPLSLLIDHIDYMVRLIGVEHVGLGSDFDGISSAPKELKDVTNMPLITKALLKRGYSKTDIKKILGENFIRVFTANTSN